MERFILKVKQCFKASLLVSMFISGCASVDHECLKQCKSEYDLCKKEYETAYATCTSNSQFDLSKCNNDKRTSQQACLIGNAKCDSQLCTSN